MENAFKKITHALLLEDLGLNRPRGAPGEDKVKHRHQGDRFSPTMGAKTPRAIPKYLEIDNTTHPKVEQLRNNPHGKIIINDNDVNKICELYNIKNLSADEPRECGTTGITIVFDSRLNKYKLVKGERY